MKKNIAIIGASYFQLPLIKKAKEMGYITHVFAWSANDVGEIEADVFHPISILKKEEILNVCKELKICGICSIASDLAMITVNYIANKMGLVGNSINSTRKSTNKHLMRIAFEENGDPSPKSILIDRITDLSQLKLKYPIIVKPTDRSGSRGIYKLEKFEGLEEMVQAAMAESFEKKVLIEEFVEGQEYSVEYISYHGQHYFLALTLKYTTGEPYFIETRHLQPAPINKKVLKKVKTVVTHALNTLEIKNGASHTEIKIDNNGDIKIIEIGARMGGDCIGSDLVQYSTGYDFVKMVIQIACGEKPDFTQTCTPIAVESVFIFNNKDLKVFKELKENNPSDLLKVVDLHLEFMNKVTDSSNRAGCYIRKARKEE